ncbi:PKD domain-containing protein [Mumia zhuanghuii]|uniref:PKD domain-containing protein n=2 Tax=Mumia zhuanghuii TaxID=2585211 RepID=A0A5C4MJ71_9ACTN|nr:PKD domain-containing protein [Mumia zhuanghuii]TNC43197.1 PKD domain-containing protein [Mumia zhuanghuii]
MSPSVSAAPSTVGTVVSDDPVNWTPHVLDGRVNSIAQVGDTIVLGGEFAEVREDRRIDPSETVVPRADLMAFEASTGKLSTTFLPDTDGSVNVVLPAGDGESVYVGGSFTTIGGQSAKNLARVRVSDGSLVAGFDGGSPTGVVKDLRLSGGRLYVAGMFTHIRGKRQPALATLDPQTGAFDPFVASSFEGVHNGGFTGVQKIDVDQQSTRLVAIGNFATVDGAMNRQLVMLDIAGSGASLSGFHTDFYTQACAQAFDSYMRDIDFSPDGSFFVVTTTGSYGGQNAPCDTAARFEKDRVGTNLQPSWIASTGGDTTYAVEITDAAVYTGGHARWQNNPFSGDRAGQGAVSRPGIAALDPVNGLPRAWNPTRTRGVGVFDFLANEQGLWVGSDTDRIGAYEYHGRIALMPLAGGTPIDRITTPELPNDLYLANTNGSLTKRPFTGAKPSGAQSVPSGGLNWNSVRGTFMVNGFLYAAWSDGSFSRRSFDGASFGPLEQVNTADQLVNLSDWDSDAATATGMFFDGGRLYYTRSGSSSLFYRYFTPESGVVGAKRLTASTGASGISFSGVRSMVLGGDKLVFTTSLGELKRIDWQRGPISGAPVAGTATTLSSLLTDGQSWSGVRSMFLFQDADGDGVPLPPTAEFTSSCTSLDCAFDAGASTAPSSVIESYAWDFGDGTSGTGVTADHRYAASGTFEVTLTVTNRKGTATSTTKQVQVTRVNEAPVAAFTTSCDELTCTFDGADSSDPDGTIASYEWGFGAGASATGQSVTHEFPDGGTYPVTLTVTDADGASASTVHDVVVARTALAFVGASSTNGNRTSHPLAVPSGTEVGDTLVLFFTANSSGSTVADPVGWQPLATGDADGIAGRVWTKTATAADLDGTVTVATSGTVKADLSVAVYRSNGEGGAVVSAAGAALTGPVTSVASPALTSPGGPTWLLSYFAVKASDATTITAAGLEPRASSEGSGGGRISALLGDSGGAVPGGSAGGIQASMNVSGSRAATFSVLVTAE